MRRICILLAIAASCGCYARRYRTPIVPMDSAHGLGLKGCMRRICILLAIAASCGCYARRYRTPIVPMDSAHGWGLNGYMRRICILLAIAALCGCGARRYRTPIVPMDSGHGLGLNGYMRRICILLAIAVLSGCRYVDRTPIVPMDSTPPIRDRATIPPERNDSPNVPPVTADPPPQRDGVNLALSGEAPRLSLPEAVTTVNGQLEDVYFAYDQFDLSPEASAALARDAELLRNILHDFPQLRITVEGHCDERGSAEYNLGLGDRRASRAIADLAQLGLPAANFAPVSYGKEAPQCTESAERCWSRNRRAHFVVRAAYRPQPSW
jgi:peptidoglycan-associated lipoprotein